MSLGRQIGRGLRGLVAAALGTDQAGAELLVARLEVCYDCPDLASGPGLMRCTRCGCFVGAKARLAGERCPVLRWPGDGAAGTEIPVSPDGTGGVPGD